MKVAIYHHSKDTITHTITPNWGKRTYTIRAYDNGKLYAKYRTYPQPKGCMTDDWTESDIRNFLRYSNDYYLVG